MKRSIYQISFLIFLMVVWAFPGTASSQVPDRYFDSADLRSDEVRLAVCCPTVLNIKKLAELRQRGFIPAEGLSIIGVFYENEIYNYKKSIKFAAVQNLDWMRFHRVSGEICYENVFQKNALTEDFAKIFHKTDGIIFFGGDDIPPRLYNRKTHLLTDIETPMRHLFELSFIFHLLGGSQDKEYDPLLEQSPEYPVMGICLGHQSLNAGTGGTLIQDIWREVYGLEYVEDVISLPKDRLHRNPHKNLYVDKSLSSYNMHPIRLLENGLLVEATGLSTEDTPCVLSGHHQAIDELGKGWTVSATSMDGRIIEAIEHEKYPYVLGVQFHPEYHTLWDENLRLRFSPEDEATSYRQVLEDNPPSFEFHKKLWSWFSERLKDAKAKRDGHSE